MHRVLVIDDEPALRKLMRRVLETSGYTVFEADNGRTGMALVEKERPNAVVCDILMPEKEGIETIRDIRRLYPEVKILAMSGGGITHNLKFLDVAQKFGAHAALSKPFRASDLADTMNSLLAGD
jgi:CheY-like chemotaxis protein